MDCVVNFYIITCLKLFCKKKLSYCSFWLENLTKICLFCFGGASLPEEKLVTTKVTKIVSK